MRRLLLLALLVSGCWSCARDSLGRGKATELLTRKFPSRRECLVAITNASRMRAVPEEYRDENT
jgi:hypothetical protein